MIRTQLLSHSTYRITDDKSGRSVVAAIGAGADISANALDLLDAKEPSPSINDMLLYKQSEIKNACEAELSTLTSEYSHSEVLSWDKQEREARAFKADPAATVPLIANLAAVRGISVSDLANRIIQKADAYTAAIAAALGKRQKLEDQLNALTDWESMAQLKW